MAQLSRATPQIHHRYGIIFPAHKRKQTTQHFCQLSRPKYWLDREINNNRTLTNSMYRCLAVKLRHFTASKMCSLFFLLVSSPAIFSTTNREILLFRVRYCYYIGDFFTNKNINTPISRAMTLIYPTVSIDKYRI